MATERNGQGESKDPLIGETIEGRFRLDEKLGEGAVGRVYKATQMSLQRPVAIKVLQGDFRRDPAYQERFEREARAMAGFNHPNIVRLMDFGEDPELSLSYLVMEYVEGLELYELLGAGRLDPRFALEITDQIAAGLAAAHDAGIIHRDLKAANLILVARPGGIFQAKVLDFGVAFPTGESVRMTATGQVFGTPAYMSPEQARSEEVDGRSDIYSLGVVLYEMLTGRLPFDADNTMGMMVKHLQEQPIPLAERLPYGDLPAGIEALVGEMLAKDPDERPASGAQVRRRVARVREQNDWRSLQVDDSQDFDAMVSQWVMPPDDPRVTMSEVPAKPGTEAQWGGEAGADAAQIARADTVAAPGADPTGRAPAQSAGRSTGRIESAPETPQGTEAPIADPDVELYDGAGAATRKKWLAAGGAALVTVLVLGGGAIWLLGGGGEGADVAVEGGESVDEAAAIDESGDEPGESVGRQGEAAPVDEPSVGGTPEGGAEAEVVADEGARADETSGQERAEGSAPGSASGGAASEANTGGSGASEDGREPAPESVPEFAAETDSEPAEEKPEAKAGETVKEKAEGTSAPKEAATVDDEPVAGDEPGDEAADEAADESSSGKGSEIDKRLKEELGGEDDGVWE